MFGRGRDVCGEVIVLPEPEPSVKIFSTPLDGVVRVVQYCNGAAKWSGLRRREVTEVEMQQMCHLGWFIDDDGYERVNGQVRFTQEGPKMWIEFHNREPDEWWSSSLTKIDRYELDGWDGDLNYGRAYKSRKVAGDLLGVYPPE